MKAVGVIVEYNPFHNGHKFHLEQAKVISGSEIVICVMSGNFLQRGEPALVSKWNRTEMALLAGADLVFELPYRFATQNADIFANGAVSLLEASGCDSICFGSESGDIEAFIHTLDFLEKHDAEFQQQVKEQISLGVSYPKAAALSFKKLSPEQDSDLLDLSKPNNILGLQYVSAIRKQKSGMTPITIARKSAEYHDENFASETIASATSIRKSLFSNHGSPENIRPFMPQSSFELLEKYKQQFGCFHSWENYWPLLKYKLLQTSPEEMRNIHGVEEGLEHRLVSTALESDTFLAFMERVKTKRYTWTRLQRACLHILMNVKKAEMEDAQKSSYLRLLGMTNKGREYLQKEKKNLGLPLVSKTSANQRELELDIRASSIYSLGLQGKEQRMLMKMEYSQPPIMIRC
ncbi:nucleotidyltransferase [Mesobacillus foraminis]|uniref:nucleotidyltransferase n=1 Tax=Mesobacillus foraminis TaxID=279826 RepID=UPI0039A261B3